MPRGTFFVLSGGEGCGKTTILKLLAKDYPALVITREPGGTPAGVLIRDILLNHKELKLQRPTELLLFFADRYQHVFEVIMPTILAGKDIGSDRYWMDTFAYQAYTGNGVADLQPIMRLVKTLGLPDPGIWILLDIDPVIGLARKEKMNKMNRIDAQPLEYHRRVREGFQYLAGQVHFTTKVIDASRPLDDVYREVVDTLHL